MTKEKEDRHAELVSASMARLDAERAVKQPTVYIFASQARGTLYIGVTSNPIGRLYQHRSGDIPGFTSRYGVHRLVLFEQFEDLPTALAREKQLKRWRRDWKINLIEATNPDWHDLAPTLGLPTQPHHGT